MPKSQYMLNNNIIRTNNYRLSREELYSYLKPRPNRRILGLIKFKLWVYRNADRGKENRVKRWFKNTVGEPPVFLDTNMVRNSVKQLNLYLNSKGYFNSSVGKSIKYRRHKANVIYTIRTKKPYTYNKITYDSQDSLLKVFMLSDSSNSLLKKGDIYDIDEIEHERNRITTDMKNHGFFRFSKEYIYFKIDSSLKLREMDIHVMVKSAIEHPANNPDTVIYTNHKRFKTNNIYLFSDYNVLGKDTMRFDTILFKVTQRRINKIPFSYYILYKDKLKYKPKTLTQAVFIKPNNYYNSEEVQETYNSLSSLQNFKFININFNEVNSSSDTNLLDCRIRLTRMPRQSFSIETEGTNTGGQPGVSADLNYQNINIFHGAEIFSIKLNLALEAQKSLEAQQNQHIIASYLPFNTLQTGIETGIEIPKFVLPWSQETFPQYIRPKTEIKFGFNYQKLNDFIRTVANVSYGYKFKLGKYTTLIGDPIALNSVNINNISPFFSNLLDSLKDPIFKNSYSNHLTEGGQYSLIFNNQKINKTQNFTFFRFNMKLAGNVLYFIDKQIINAKLLIPDQGKGYYDFLNNRYSQFFRFDGDYRYYNKINELNIIVYRAVIGIGVAYGNLPSLPFEESFFGGGANDVRAWEIRSLGPGSYLDTTKTKFNKIGDIKLEGNVEYRFPIYKLIKGAVFADAGNIWLKNKDLNFGGGDFQIDRFYKEFALGTGIGIRLDFSFFVVRVDAALPLKDPSQPEGHRWVLHNQKLRDVIWNFGIGYPF
jgi:outer membrane protein assembly factor BamA